MTFFELVALLITLTALFSYLNLRFIKLPTVIGVMLISLLVSLALIAAGHVQPGISSEAERLLKQIKFDEALLQGMLSFMLFAGALQVNLEALSRQKGIVFALAFGGVILSMFFFGTLIYLALEQLGIGLQFAWCLLFGALVSPTDPLAVLGILQRANIPQTIRTQIVGESLFNDGVGIVLFLVCLKIATADHPVPAKDIGLLFVSEAGGGALFGLGAGWITYLLLKSVDDYQVEVLLTLALVTGGYATASALGFSGPIAIVVAGLLIGNRARRLAMSDITRQYVDKFWALVNEMLNALLFMLIGLEVLILEFTRELLMAGLLAVPILLLARWASVGLIIRVLGRWKHFVPGTIMIMTWGGLRGGIAVALALSLPPGPERDTVLAITYVLVVFSILFQGLTVGPLIKRLLGSRYAAGADVDVK
ncbi:MAG: sodium:proton antiporter [Nitrosospira sp.]